MSCCSVCSFCCYVMKLLFCLFLLLPYYVMKLFFCLFFNVTKLLFHLLIHITELLSLLSINIEHGVKRQLKLLRSWHPGWQLHGSKPKSVVINEIYGRLNTCLMRSISSAILTRIVPSMNCYVYVIVCQCILYCISFELLCYYIIPLILSDKNPLHKSYCLNNDR